MKFNVGDDVLCFVRDQMIGVGTVVEFDGHYAWPYDVKFRTPEGHEDTGAFAEAELEAVK